ncbi:hypothetical protein D1872_312810 [compost metagenome]
MAKRDQMGDRLIGAVKIIRDHAADREAFKALVDCHKRIILQSELMKDIEMAGRPRIIDDRRNPTARQFFEKLALFAVVVIALVHAQKIPVPV